MEPDYERELEVFANRPHSEIFKFFKYKHLKHEDLQNVSKAFASMALFIARTIEPSAERTVALRKLLESKDAAVRAAL